MAAAQDQLGQSATKLGAASEMSAKKLASLERQYRALVGSAQPAIKAQIDFERNAKNLQIAVDQDNARLNEANQTLHILADRLDKAKDRQLAFNAAVIAGKQDRFNELAGVSVGPASKSATDSADAFLSSVGGLAGVARAKAEQIGEEFGRELNERLIAGTHKAAKDAAAVFAADMDRLDQIAQQKAQQIGANFTADLNARMGIGTKTKSASQSMGVFEEVAREQDAMAASATRLRAAINPLEAEMGRIGKEMAEYRKVLRAGMISQDEFAALQPVATRRLQDFEKNLRNAGSAGRLMSGEMANLSFQLNDVVTGIALGQSPFMILAQQGGQVYQILAGARGGVGAAVKELAGNLRGLITPASVGFGAIIGGAGAALLALNSYLDAQQKVQMSLTGGGRASGATPSSVNKVAEQGTSTFGLSLSESRELAAALAATGKIGQDMLLPIVKIGKDIAHAFGIDAAKATELLAKSFADPVKGAEELNERLRFLDANLKKNIQSAVAQNDMQRAQQLLLEGVKSGLVGVDEAVSKSSKGWTAVTNAISGSWGALGQFVARAADLETLPIDEKLKQTRILLDRLTERRDMGLPAFDSDNRIAKLTKEFEALTAAKEMDKAKTDEVKRSMDSLIEQKAVEDASPFEAINQKLRDRLVLLERLKERQLDSKDPNVNEKAPTTVTAIKSTDNEIAINAQKQQQQVVLNALMDQYKAKFPGITAEQAKNLELMRLQQPVVQATTEAERLRAEEVLRRRTLELEGVPAAIAAKTAADERALKEKEINTEADKQLKALRQQGELLRATSDYERDRIQYAQTYNSLIEKGVDALKAQQIATQELRNTEQQRENTQREAAERQQQNSSSSGSMNYTYDPNADPAERDRQAQAAYNAERERRYQQYGSGYATGAGQTSTIDTSFNNTAFGTDGTNAFTQAQERHQQFLTEMANRLAEALKKNQEALEENTEALSLSLDPIFSQGHDYLNSLRIGYYKAATGLSAIVGGSGTGDKTPVHMMLEPGELLEVTPKSEIGRTTNNTKTSANDNRQYVVNNNNQTIIMNGNTSPRDRLLARQRAQGF